MSLKTCPLRDRWVSEEGHLMIRATDARTGQCVNIRDRPEDAASAAPDLLATRLAEAALTVLVRTCRQEVAAASRDDMEAACAAMRAQARHVIDRLLDDARAAPWVAEAAFHAAALELARAGIAVLRPR